MGEFLETGEFVEKHKPEDSHGLRHFAKRYPSLFRAAEFAVGSGVGFLDTEIILILGTCLLYQQPNAPPSAFSSPPFVALNIFAFVFGVTVAFFIDESLILHGDRREISYNFHAILLRLCQFQLIFLAGNLMMTGVELLMLKEFGLPPVLGLIAGAIISFPVSYFFSIRYIWKIRGNHPVIVQNRPQEIPVHLVGREQLPEILLDDPISTPPDRITAPYGDYYLDVQECRFDVSPSAKEEAETRIDFSLKVDLDREDLE